MGEYHLSAGSLIDIKKQDPELQIGAVTLQVIGKPTIAKSREEYREKGKVEHKREKKRINDL